MFNRKLKNALKNGYGRAPEVTYYDGEMDWIKKHYRYEREKGKTEFLIDDITWNDLGMDDVFKRINTRLTSPGEQQLYLYLRKPCLNEKAYKERLVLVDTVGANEDLRLKLQFILAKLGRRRLINFHQVETNEKPSPLLYIYLTLVFLVFATLLAAIFINEIFALITIGIFIFNAFFHYYQFKQIEYKIGTPSYIIGMILTVKKLKKLNDPTLDAHLKEADLPYKKLKHLIKAGMFFHGNEAFKDELKESMLFMLNSGFLLDLICYEILKYRFTKQGEDVLTLHRVIGTIDASIGIASYRESLKGAFIHPTIDFSHRGKPYLTIKQLVHPLLPGAVANDIDTHESILLTGSNASGKSTYLRSVALNVLLAQTIGIVHGKTYIAPAFRIFTSMAITDDLFAGDSYFIAEIKSIKRIVDASVGVEPIFCIIDEILRGTNTIERISASSELLRAIGKRHVIALAATHDLELCDLLKCSYAMNHFSETVTDDGEVTFDFMIKDGPARTRNAIKLLARLGFDEEIINNANASAQAYLASGKW